MIYGEFKMKDYHSMTKEELNSEYVALKLELRNLVVAESMGIDNSKQRAIHDRKWDTVFNLLREHWNKN